MGALPGQPTHAATAQPGSADHDYRARVLLRQHGLRCTSARLAVLEELESGAGHLSVAQIHARLRDQGRDVDLATVYRTVAMLVQVGAAHALTVDERSATYGLSDEPHHHAICTGCGSVIEIPAQRLSSALIHAGAGSRFALSDRAGLTLRGLCPDCQCTHSA